MSFGVLATDEGKIADGGSERLSGKRFYHPELDVLRFFAFCMVFASHATPEQSALLGRGIPKVIVEAIAAIASTGPSGVDVFFVLSAYLITELLLREKIRSNNLNVGFFYMRRILRIWPLYFVFLFSAVAASGWLSDKQDSWRTLVAFALLGGNWWVIFRGWPSLLIFPLWSISVEEQFYLVWPPLVRRLSRRALLASCGVMLLIASFVQIYLVMNRAEGDTIGCNTFVRLDSIALGIGAALILDGRSPRFADWKRLTLFLTGFGALMLAGRFVYRLDGPVHPSILFGYPLVAVGSVAMLIAILSPAPPWFARGPLVYLGRISYGLYVFHALALVLVNKMAKYLPRGHEVRGGIVLAFLMTVILAALSYHFLERPFLRLKERFTLVPSRAIA